MPAYRGLTWDHPRGRRPLEETAAEWAPRGVQIAWEAQPLEGFEAHPIDDLAARYDLIVLDHPHLGDALATGSLRPLEEVLGPDRMAALDGRFVGPSVASYRLDGRTWALPLDAATQVAARDARLLEAAPGTWAEVEDVAREVPVALSLAGPHALLSLFSVSAALGAPPVDEPDLPWLDESAALDALELLTRVDRLAPEGYRGLNPIGLLERLGSADPLAYVPLVYGYVPYADPRRERPVAFSDAPSVAPGGVPGSIIGGTGVAVSTRASVTDELVAYLEWLVADDTQRMVVPALSGQPAAIAAWADPAVDAAAGHFYGATRATIEASSVRPRAAGYPHLQAEGSALVRAALAGELTPAETVAGLGALAARTVRSTT